MRGLNAERATLIVLRLQQGKATHAELRQVAGIQQHTLRHTLDGIHRALPLVRGTVYVSIKQQL